MGVAVGSSCEFSSAGLHVALVAARVNGLPQTTRTNNQTKRNKNKNTHKKPKSQNKFDSLPPPLWVGEAYTRLTPIAADDPGFWASQSSGRALIGEVTLRANRLRGSIPPALLALPILSLDLGSNFLTGSVPDYAGLNPFVRQLYLGNNHVRVLCFVVCCACCVLCAWRSNTRPALQPKPLAPPDSHIITPPHTHTHAPQKTQTQIQNSLTARCPTPSRRRCSRSLTPPEISSRERCHQASAGSTSLASSR